MWKYHVWPTKPSEVVFAGNDSIVHTTLRMLITDDKTKTESDGDEMAYRRILRTSWISYRTNSSILQELILLSGVKEEYCPWFIRKCWNSLHVIHIEKAIIQILWLVVDHPMLYRSSEEITLVSGRTKKLFIELRTEKYSKHIF